MHYTYKTHGTCSTEINFDVEDYKIYHLSFTGKCNENIKGIKCGFKDTSCPDQLVKALEEIK